MNTRYSIRTYINKPRLYKGNTSGQIMIRVRWEHNEVGLTLGMYGNPDKWDSHMQLPKQGTTHHHGQKEYTSYDIRRAIGKYKDAIDDTFQTFAKTEKIPTVEEFKSLCYEKLGLNARQVATRKKKASMPLTSKEMEAFDDFFTVFDKFIQEQLDAGLWSKETSKKYTTIKNLLWEFDNKLSFETLDYAKMVQFQAFLVGKKYFNVTTREMINKFIPFLERCSKGKHPLFDDKDVLNYECKLKDCPSSRRKLYLEKEEFIAIYSCAIPHSKQYLQRVRDVFIFMVLTGMRISDIKKLTIFHLRGERLSTTMEKTDKPIDFPLSEEALRIANYYKEFHFKNNKLFPPISSQKFNKYLKEIAELAHVDATVTLSHKCGSERIDIAYPKYQIISSHWARRTCVTIGKEEGLSNNEVRSITGHTNDASLTPYNGITETEKQRFKDIFNMMLQNALDKQH